jgi:hypothetical protein
MIENTVQQSRLISSHNIIPANRDLKPRHLDRAIKIAKGEFTPTQAAKQDAAEVAADDIKQAVTPVEEKAAPIEQTEPVKPEEPKADQPKAETQKPMKGKPAFQE